MSSATIVSSLFIFFDVLTFEVLRVTVEMKRKFEEKIEDSSKKLKRRKISDFFPRKNINSENSGKKSEKKTVKKKLKPKHKYPKYESIGKSNALTLKVSLKHACTEIKVVWNEQSCGSSSIFKEVCYMRIL